MTTHVFLVRHGATTLSAEDRFAGAVDVPLSDEGRDQARALGKRLAGVKLAAAYCSPMSRTQETAWLVLEGRRLSPEPVDAFREIGHGAWEGLSRDDVKARFVDEYSRWEADPFTFAPAGGETGLAVLARALPALLDRVQRHAGGHVLIVSHKATIRLLIGHLLGFDLRGYRDRLDQSPCGLNILDVQEGGAARLLLYNDVSHYATVPGPSAKRLSPWWA